MMTLAAIGKRQFPEGEAASGSSVAGLIEKDGTNSKRSKAGPRALADAKRKGFTVDDIHDKIHLEPVIKAMTDTLYFQRLRRLKQLATAEHVYMNCNHTRFEHSLGVAHLAYEVAKNVMEEQKQLGVTRKDCVCVKIAGLLHDIGHGPYSHTYETFVNRLLPEYLENNPEEKRHYEGLPEGPGPDWSHEQMSLHMIDCILAELGMAIDLDNLDAPLKQIRDDSKSIDASTFGVGKDGRGEILTSRDFVFIKECIWGEPVPDVCRKLGTDGFIGREGTKHWMYDIVNNKHSGLDVGKLSVLASKLLSIRSAS